MVNAVLDQIARQFRADEFARAVAAMRATSQSRPARTR